VAGGWRDSDKYTEKTPQDCYSELRWASATQNGNRRVLLEEKRQMESGSDNLKRFETTDVKG